MDAEDADELVYLIGEYDDDGYNVHAATPDRETACKISARWNSTRQPGDPAFTADSVPLWRSPADAGPNPRYEGTPPADTRTTATAPPPDPPPAPDPATPTETELAAARAELAGYSSPASAERFAAGWIAYAVRAALRGGGDIDPAAVRVLRAANAMSAAVDEVYAAHGPRA